MEFSTFFFDGFPNCAQFANLPVYQMFNLMAENKKPKAFHCGAAGAAGVAGVADDADGSGANVTQSLVTAKLCI